MGRQYVSCGYVGQPHRNAGERNNWAVDGSGVLRDFR